MIPQICQTDRQLREEALEIYLGKNRFLLNDALEQGWLASLSESTIAHIRMINVQDLLCLHAKHLPPREPNRYAVRVAECDITLTHHPPFRELQARFRLWTRVVCEERAEKWCSLMRIFLNDIIDHRTNTFTLEILELLWKYWDAVGETYRYFQDGDDPTVFQQQCLTIADSMLEEKRSKNARIEEVSG
jgi:hypothetical protein